MFDRPARKAVKKKTRTEITIETDEVFVVTQTDDEAFTWCAQCKKPARTLTVEQAAAIAGVSSSEIFSRVDAGEIHFAGTPDGRLQICVNSLC